MVKIKTRDAVKGLIKSIDKVNVATQRMKQSYIFIKEKAEHSTHAVENNAEEYAVDKFQSGIQTVGYEGVHQFDKQGRKSVHTTKENIYQVKDVIGRFKEKRTVESLKKQSAKATNAYTTKLIKAIEQDEKIIKESTKSVGNKTIKSATKGTIKSTQKSVKTAEHTAKAAIKTSKQSTTTAQQTAKATTKASQKAFQTAKATAKVSATAVRSVAKRSVAVLKAIILTTKALISAIIAGGWIMTAIIIILCLIGLMASSVFGIFFSGENSGSGQTMQTVVREINLEYDNHLDEIINNTPHDILEMSGSRAVWKDVLAVYSVKVNTDPDNPQEVATMDDNKKQLLKELFWEMNSISSRTETKTEIVVSESDDGHGNIVETESTVTKTYLYITVTHKTVDEMAEQFGFNLKQKSYLIELLKEENNALWSAVLYGINSSEGQIVTIALSQVGNIGGQPYWSWYGFNSRVEWCATFVSWCANECGYIDTGVIPKFASCTLGSQWFKDRGQWADKSHEPAPGTIIFFDWENDGITDHVGIVEKYEDGVVYTIEGNSGDACRTRSYSVGSNVIYGYGIPAY